MNRKIHRKRTVVIITAIAAVVITAFILTLISLNTRNRIYGFAREIPEEEQLLRLAVEEHIRLIGLKLDTQ